ncbi:MAG: cohesin domain-containing protein [Clostridia bacterium]
MKKLKHKVGMLTIMVFAFLILAPNVFAASVFENKPGVTEDNADFVVNYTIDKEISSETGKAEVSPGDIVTVTINLDKLPDNGYGICAFSNRIAFNPEQLEVVVTGKDIFGKNIYAFIPGQVGCSLGFDETSAAVIDVPSDNRLKQISFGSAKSASNSSRLTGIIATIQFRVKDNVSGNLEMFVLSDSTEDNGFAIAGVKLDSQGRPVTDPNMSYYVKDNMSNKLHVN